MGTGCLLHMTHDTLCTLQVIAETPWSQNSSRKTTDLKLLGTRDCHNFYFFFPCRTPFPSRRTILSAFLPGSSFRLQLPEMQSSCAETLLTLRVWASLALGQRTGRRTTLWGSPGIPGVPLQAWAKEGAPKQEPQCSCTPCTAPMGWTVTTRQLCRDNWEGATAKAWEKKG